MFLLSLVHHEKRIRVITHILHLLIHALVEWQIEKNAHLLLDLVA